jgi:CelD/BcsL family acetyltransferase involved in cellulose biosynthesis
VTGSRPTSPHRGTLELELLPVRVEDLSRWEQEWRELEQRSGNVNVYRSYDWLRSWAEVYQPRKLLLTRAVQTDAKVTVALGLVEVDRVRGWRFAGGTVSACRAPLCAAGIEDQLWEALARWLHTRPRAWSTLEASEVSGSAEALPGARLDRESTSCLSTPDSFDAYSATLTSKQRTEMRRRIRQAEAAGIKVEPVPAEEITAAIADFLRLHRQRALIKGERHASIDERLGRLLEKVADARSIDLSLFEIRRDGRRIAISVQLGYGTVAYPYNLGWEPEVSRLAPGILLGVSAVTDAIAREVHVIDMGPGAQSYKLALGFQPQERLTVTAVNPSAWGIALRAAGEAYARLRGRSGSAGVESSR